MSRAVDTYLLPNTGVLAISNQAGLPREWMPFSERSKTANLGRRSDKQNRQRVRHDQEITMGNPNLLRN